jgi:outer membrane immunogenic protein
MLMKKFLGLLGVIFVAGPALGADMSVPRGAPWAVPSWTGCYVGVNLGGVTGSDKDRWTNITETPAGAGGAGATTGFAVGAATVLPAAANATLNGSGFSGGGQLGCIFQSDSWVWGAEADIQYTGLDSTRSATSLGDTNGGPSTIVPGQITESFSSRWLSTIRGRLGYAIGPVLLYGTGGVAFADVHYADLVCFLGGAGIPGCNTASSNETRIGFAAGGGIEWEFAPSWSVKAEYLFVDLGTTNFDSAFSDPRFTSATITHNHHLTENLGRVGLNVRF